MFAKGNAIIKINDLIIQNSFSIFKTEQLFPLKTFHEVPKTKYSDLNQEPPFLKINSNYQNDLNARSI